MKLSEIDNTYKAVAGIVLATVFMITFHDQYITESEAMEQQVAAQAQLIMLRVDNKESEKRTLIREKARAMKAGEMGEVSRLTEDIKTLREQVTSLCLQVPDC